MIDINLFLQAHLKEIETIISSLKNEFSSHDFIEKFAKQFESDYIEMLVKYQNTGKAFQIVHGQIASFLAENMGSLDIVKNKKDKSETVFGTIDVIQYWAKR